MKALQIHSDNRFCAVALFLITLFVISPPLSTASTRTDHASFQRSIVDYRPRLNPRYKKIKRIATTYIIVHTSELGLQSTLRVVSQGKWVHDGRRCTAGGHTHYVIARNGRTYRILDKQWVADHAGRSMWDGKTDLSQISIGIELVGYHYAPLSEAQYRSVGKLIDILQGVYDLDDRAVLTHSQIAYGLPNRWFKKNHRGRKRCAKNFIRAKAGLGPTWRYDPDVRAGRLTADADLANVFYNRQTLVAEVDEANIISKTNTAWAIAGEDFDSPTTVYKFPDGRVTTGHQIASSNSWNRIPAKTVVLLNQEGNINELREDGPVKTISDGITAWALAGKLYNHETTIYLLPSGHIRKGSMINDWDDLPARTKLIIGYEGPYELSKERSAYGIAGNRYKDPQTIYYLPSNQVLSGNKIEDFSRLQSGTLVFLPSSL
jgi:N-acetylmuramoyl-L-alanine amidase